uniref:hypothetical protein n=1 Tax=Gracilaria domingensis TaxID=172961 RepID=UPI001D125865|nr:hypothetical protein LK222_mgp01 [Gracilaria domingensis]UAD89614.1 hypothetical protein [Gracilaria domingensis]
MSRFRLNCHSNFIEVFDSLDNRFSNNQSFLIFNDLSCVQVSYKFGKLSKIIFPNTLFLECLQSQKFLFSSQRNFKKLKSLLFFGTLRKDAVFIFFEILLHSTFLKHKSVVNYHKVKISYLDLFWPNTVLDKLMINTMKQNRFMVHIK